MVTLPSTPVDEVDDSQEAQQDDDDQDHRGQNVPRCVVQSDFMMSM